jgi:HPt (histidine-containing phosphotransfer) domain-containing protein
MHITLTGAAYRVQRSAWTMVDTELNELKREFLDEAREKVDEMQSALEGAPSADIDRITYLAHQLKGAGGSYGYQRISADAAALEKALESSGEGEEIDAQIQQYVVSLRHEIDRCAREL